MSDWQDEPGLWVTCECGKVYTLHVHTVCPMCHRWPTRKAMRDVLGTTQRTTERAATGGSARAGDADRTAAADEDREEAAEGADAQ